MDVSLALRKCVEQPCVCHVQDGWKAAVSDNQKKKKKTGGTKWQTLRETNERQGGGERARESERARKFSNDK